MKRLLLLTLSLVLTVAALAVAVSAQVRQGTLETARNDFAKGDSARTPGKWVAGRRTAMVSSRTAPTSRALNTSTKKVDVGDVPTILLLDTSGSMQDRGKIGQARDAGLDVVAKMKQDQRPGQTPPRVAIWFFGGDCDPGAIREVLGMTRDLDKADAVFRYQVPKPDGGTPLFIAVDEAVETMKGILNADKKIKAAKIIILSDGENTCTNTVRPNGVYSQGSTILYDRLRILTIGFDITPGSAAERDLNYLSSVSRGRYLPASNGMQLTQAFTKLTRVQAPRVGATVGPEFNGGVDAMLNQNFESAFRVFTMLVGSQPKDPAAHWNLAISCEETRRYKCASTHFKRYLELEPDSDDAPQLPARLAELEKDYRTNVDFRISVLRNDILYLEEYYQRLFKVNNDALAEEFIGFVNEKGLYYRGITKVLEITSVPIDKTAVEIADSLNYLKIRTGLKSFDRDAVALLGGVVGNLKDLLSKIERHKF